MSLPHHSQDLASDLFIRCKRIEKDPASKKYYGEYTATDGAHWTVNCRNRRIPRRTALPLSFATCNDARRAMEALQREGLCTDRALYQRIKVDLDWEGVRRIMIEALRW